MTTNSPTSAQPAAYPAPTLTRREAIKRAALVLGVAFSPSFLTNALQAATQPAGAKPVYLNTKQWETTSAVAERILPRSDTPGALDVGVPAFIDLMFGKYLSPAEKKSFATGLTEVESMSTVAHRRSFLQLTATQQDALLMELATASGKKERTFFHLMKELTVVGYFTSETVGKTVLNYDPVPGRFDPDIPLTEVGNVQWTK